MLLLYSRFFSNIVGKIPTQAGFRCLILRARKPPHEMQQQQQQRKNNSGSEGKVQFFEIIFIFYSKGLKIIAIIKYFELKYLSIDVSKKPIMISN